MSLLSFSNNKSTNLLDLSHDLIGISGAGGLHGPGEPQWPGLHLGGLVHHVGIGDVALTARGERAVHAHGVSLAASTANTEAAVHPPATREQVTVSWQAVKGRGSSLFSTKVRLTKKIILGKNFVITWALSRVRSLLKISAISLPKINVINSTNGR